MIYCIIPSYNRRDHTGKCLHSLHKQTFSAMSIVVVDHGSSDGTVEMIRHAFPHVNLLEGDRNLWWAGAMNLGIRYVLEHAHDESLVLLMNNDTTIEPDFIARIVGNVKSHPDCLIGSIAVDGEDQTTIVDGGVRINWLSAKYSRLNAKRDYRTLDGGSIQRVDFLTGRGTLIPTSVFRRIGLFDEKPLPHYGADYEFSTRAKRAGYDLIVDYNCAVFSDVFATGLNNERSSLSSAKMLESLFSMRSPNNIYRRWNFARLACPAYLLPSFFVLDIGRLLAGAIRNQFRHSFRQM